MRWFHLTAPLLLLASATATLAGPEKSAAPVVPAAAVEHDGHHYLLVDDVEELSWGKARRECEGRGAQLVVVTTETEADFIAGLCAGRYMYLGASDEQTEGVWRWIDGSPWEFTRWMKGQPNDYSGSEDFLATYDDGEWVDVDAEGDGFWMPTGYICEWGD